jgi:superfamily II DNA or RNA helicase
LALLSAVLLVSAPSCGKRPGAALLANKNSGGRNPAANFSVGEGSLRELRQDQIELLVEIEEAIESGLRRLMIQAPCGFGKTLVASTLLKKYCDEGKRVMFVVPAISLISQTIEVFNSEGLEDIGVMQAYHMMTNWDMPIQICSIQTLSRRNLPKSDIVIIDEAHIWFKFFEKWMLDPEWKDIPFVGLSATPWAKGLGAWYQKLIIGSTIGEAIDQGILSRFKVFAPAHPDLTKVRTLAGDFHEGDLEKVMNQKRLVADIVSTWLLRAKDLPTLCFCVNRAHAKQVQEQFIAAGINAGYQDSFTRDDERTAIKIKFHNGEMPVVCSVNTMILGIDWKIKCLIWACPTKSEMKYVQGTGRGLRTDEGKDECLILDHSDNTLRLGFVDSIHHAELNTGKKPLAASVSPIRLPKECPQCTFLKPPKTLECPNCGFATKPVVDVVVEKGELVEFTKRGKPKDLFEKPDTYAGLLWYGQQKNYKAGWAFHKYFELFQEYPQGLGVVPKPPSTELAKWIKSRTIAWAHSKYRTPLRP